MRPAIFGTEVKTAGNRFIGVNLGYNFLREYDSVIPSLVNNLNREVVQNKGIFGLSAKDKKDIGLMLRYQNTPFKDGILHPRLETYVRNIEIRHGNRDLSYRLLDNDEYVMFGIMNSRTRKMYTDAIGSKRIFQESDLICMSDYQPDMLLNNRDYRFRFRSGDISVSRNGENHLLHSNTYRALYSTGGFMFIMRRGTFSEQVIIPTLEKSLKSGSLAIAGEEPRLFREKGCCIICLDEAYKPM